MAQAYSEQDHDDFWADNEDMKNRTKAYAKRAAAIAQGICGNYNHPWKKDAYRSPWKLRIIDLEGDRRGLLCDDESEKVRDILRVLDWQSTRNESAMEEKRRYIILLEDLSPRVAELLGVLMDIPPEFFLSHSGGHNELSVVDKQLFKRGSSKYWKVAVPQKRTMSQASERGSYTISCGSHSRGFGLLDDDASSWNLTFDSYVSYWANSYGDGSWITVVLMDPHPTHLIFNPDSNPNDSKIIHLNNFKSKFDQTYREFMLDSAENEFTQPQERSIFDAVAKVYDNAPVEFPDDPFSATYAVRNCIRAAWEQRVWWEESKVSDAVYENVWNHKASRSSLTSEDFENRMAINDQAMKEYQELMGTQDNIREARHNIRAIIHKFRPRDTYSLAEKTSKIEDLIKKDIEHWEFLDEKLQYVEEYLNGHMKMYSARSTMEEAYEAKMQSRESMKQTREANRQTAAANRMARSSGQLTKIATIIVPCTFVASIFSMGGDFAAGESLFYVYWIVSVPITVGLLTWILHEDIADVVKKSRGWYTSRRTKLGKGSVSEGSEV